MNEGQFVQIGSPTEIYEFPKNRFVADFIGSANIFEGSVVENSSSWIKIQTDIGNFRVETNNKLTVGDKVFIGVRPEKIKLTKLSSTLTKKDGLIGVIDDIGYFGNSSRYKVKLKSNRIVDVTVPNQVRLKDLEKQISEKDEVYLEWDTSSVMMLSK